MKKIAVITMGVRLNQEKGYTRFRYICEFLADAGYEVDLITTTFQHWEKEQRDLEKIKADDYKFGLKFIYEPGYKKNIDLQRIRSHRIAAKNLTALLEKEGDYDLLYAEIPPNDVALAAARYAEKKGIPFVVDVNDLWPEAMRMVLDIPVVSSVLFYPLQRDAEKVYGLTSGVIGTSDEYRDRPFLHQKREIPRETVYVGNDLADFDNGAEEYTGAGQQSGRRILGDLCRDDRDKLRHPYNGACCGRIGKTRKIRYPFQDPWRRTSESRTGRAGKYETDLFRGVCRLCAVWKDGGLSEKVRHPCQFICEKSAAEYRDEDRRLSGCRKSDDQYLHESGIPRKSGERRIWRQYHPGRRDRACGYDRRYV